MPEERVVTKIYKWKLIASRPVGRPKIRWMDTVLKGIQAMKVVSCKRAGQDRNKYKSIVEQAKTHIVPVSIAVCNGRLKYSSFFPLIFLLNSITQIAKKGRAIA
jgi:hypothetical protein